MFAYSDGDNVEIGLPFDTVTGQLLGPNPCLDGYRSVTNKTDPASFDQRLVQVSNKLGVMRALNIDIAASGRVFAASVSGKMNFAGSTSLNQTSLSYALYANYQAPPEKITPQDGQMIGLAGFAKDLRNQSEDAFRSKCGDAYINLVFKGAEAYAVLSFLSVNQSTRAKISASLDAKGINWKASAAADAEVNQQSSLKQLDITYSQTGGLTGKDVSGTPVDTTWEELKNTINSIRGTRSPVTTAYQVVPYDNLPDWSYPDLTPSPDILRLAYYRAAYGTLLDSLKPLVNNPAAAEFTHVLGRNQNAGAGDQGSLTILQTDLLSARTVVENLYRQCSAWTVSTSDPNCSNTKALHQTLAGDATQEPYEFMTRLPLKMGSFKDAFHAKDNLVEASFQQNLMFARNAYCEQSRQQNIPHPACKSEPDLRSRYQDMLAENLTATWYPAPGAYELRSLFRRDATCLTAQTAGSKDKRLFVQTCDNPRQRFNWLDSGQLRIRSGQCLAAPVNNKAPLAPHNCISKEGVQMWRFIPLKRDASSKKPGTPGLLQEAGYGRCLYWGDTNSGEKTFVRTHPCDMSTGKQIWTFKPRP